MQSGPELQFINCWWPTPLSVLPLDFSPVVLKITVHLGAAVNQLCTVSHFAKLASIGLWGCVYSHFGFQTFSSWAAPRCPHWLLWYDLQYRQTSTKLAQMLTRPTFAILKPKLYTAQNIFNKVTWLHSEIYLVILLWLHLFFFLNFKTCKG